MEKVEWQDAYCIDVDEIDVQHRKLLSIVNEFFDVATGHPADYPIKVGRCLKKLADYTHYHFASEEMLMEQYQFPNIQQHKEEHANFIMQLSAKPLIAGIGLYFMLQAKLLRKMFRLAVSIRRPRIWSLPCPKLLPTGAESF